ncbi:SDR family NAD(P)-dependent oxidoreductase [Mycobacterium palustre]|uniref:Short-chain dehydrogenase n=1 Tax=Mycobacterium palustre TaxID=153971 RepID=A0A1X1ZF39_9MYCO|nr:SDR family NAD(P)-dependent oxidoreductase [Mycobacterium palustre]MCV7101374.1 SDR family NAD(P)-dependent oxidoreductase [Mycobacterium palustre]ORW21994.1 hypothetical protein AWC19_13680 [Mycobacterium palustre]
MKDFHGKVAVITGGGSGIGRGMARAFAAEGMKVVVADIELDAAESVANEINGVAAHVDTSSYESVQQLADKVFDTFGAVHLLCNNAGVGTVGGVLSTTIDDWRWTISVNVFGPIHGVLAFLPRMKDQPGEAHIVNTGSISGLAPVSQLAAYSTSKFAVVALSEVMREELAQFGIGVTVVCPGTVRTRILEADRNRPAQFGRSEPKEKRETSMSEAIDPDDLGKSIASAVRRNDLYLTAFSSAANNQAMPAMVRERCAAVLSALPA